MAQILLVRHGESTYNAEGRWTGATDVPLTAKGEQDALAAARCLSAADFSAAASSDLRRARRTAELFAGVLGLDEVLVEPRLRERSMGEWEGLTRDEIARRWPDLLEAHRAGRLDAPPGGEPLGEFEARIRDGLLAVAGVGEAGAVLVVAHGGVLRVLDRTLGATPIVPVNCGGRWYRCVDGDIAAAQRWRPGVDGATA